jgi:hypothetical protein
MEFRRAYRDEQPDENLVRRHEHDIFPLLKKRHLFAGVEHFLLYDLYREDGTVNENVFAYSNRSGEESALVLYNNAFERAWGWIGMSAAFAERRPAGAKSLVRRHLSEALGTSSAAGSFLVFREQRSGLRFLRRGSGLAGQGLFVRLEGYQSQVFFDFHELVDDAAGRYGRLCDALDGAGVQDLAAALRALEYSPLYAALCALLEAGLAGPESAAYAEALAAFSAQAAAFSGDSRAAERMAAAGRPAAREAPAELEPPVEVEAPVETPGAAAAKLPLLLARLLRAGGPAIVGRSREWGLGDELRAFFEHAGAAEPRRSSELALILAEAGEFDWSLDSARGLFASDEGAAFLGLNVYRGTRFCNREAFIALVSGLAVLNPSGAEAESWIAGMETAGFDVDEFLGLISGAD